MSQMLHDGGPSSGAGLRPVKWAKVLDQTSCIGCHACTTACKSENEVPLGVTRTYVKYVDVGVFPQVRRAFQVTRCNQCEDSPCTTACPTAAMYRRSDGIVDFDKSVCIGCKACMAACPYDAIFINPEDHSAEKCNFCAHRLDMGLEPACVVVCPVGAILVGDMNDPGSVVASMAQRSAVTVRRPEKETRPKLFYTGAHAATLDPIAARRPGNDLFMWSEQGERATRGTGHEFVGSGRPDDGHRPNSSAAAVLAYDIPHRAPWDWRVSLYTWTKGIAAGVWLVAIALALAGTFEWSDGLVQWAAPLLGAGFLAATAGLLIWDLEHPGRFLLIMTRPQWRSWLVRGGFILAGYGAVLGVHLLGAVLDSDGVIQAAAFPGAPLAVMAAVYTAYLFAQAKARDLWQNPLLPAHLAVQAVLAGAATLAVADVIADGGARDELGWIVAAAAAAHLLLVLGEVTLTHPTAHAHLASREMTRGRYAPFFIAGVMFCAGALTAPLIGAAAAPLALLGLLAHEHAYVQAGQSVPLA
jgi:Fe-S-cluster-containing dehydrogenase component/formate-dependent nitrite reductase membrane component NrfD